MSGAPTGGFLRGLEMGLWQGPSPPSAAAAGGATAVVAAATAAAAESSARAASEAVVLLLGQAGGGGARRAGVLSDAVESLASAFGLKTAVVGWSRFVSCGSSFLCTCVNGFVLAGACTQKTVVVGLVVVLVVLVVVFLGRESRVYAVEDGKGGLFTVLTVVLFVFGFMIEPLVLSHPTP